MVVLRARSRGALPPNRFSDATPVVENLETLDKLSRRGREQRERYLEREHLRRQLGPLAVSSDPATDPVVDFYGESAEEVRNDAVISVVIEDATGEWVAQWLIAEQAGRYVVRSLLLEPVDRSTPAGGITTQLLRELRPAEASGVAGQALAEARNRPAPEVIRNYEDFSHLWRLEGQDDRSRRGPEPPAARKAGRPPLSDEHLAEVALAYLSELPRGGGVLRRMAARFGREPATMRDQIHLARQRGWLTPALKPGMNGASAGPRLVEWMREKESQDDA
jgi:hypothetical protein